MSYIDKSQWHQPKHGDAEYHQAGWVPTIRKPVTIAEDRRAGGSGCITIIAALSLGVALGWALFPIAAAEFARNLLTPVMRVLGF